MPREPFALRGSRVIAFRQAVSAFSGCANCAYKAIRFTRAWVFAEARLAGDPTLTWVARNRPWGLESGACTAAMAGSSGGGGANVSRS